MSVKVNLLPREVAQRNAAARAKVGIGVAAVVFVVLLGLVYVWQVGRVSDANDRLATAEVERVRLQGEVAELNEFALLQDRSDLAQATLTTTMGGEASIAGILQDVAAVMPTDAELSSLTVTVSDVAIAGPFDLGGPGFGKITAAAMVRNGHAPGVERFIIQFDKVASFFNVWVSASTVAEETGVSTFSFDLELGPEVFTRRYVDGLPEELR